jgi:putative transposase
MSTAQYNPEIHHRRSIRLKGHDYAGGGTYFVTICAHRNAGDIFADASVKEMVGRVWDELPQSAVGDVIVPAVGERGTVGAGLVPAAFERGTHEGSPYVVMPDHFHGVLALRSGERSLGDVVGAFKSLVVHEYIAGVKAGQFARFPGKIWHRNYYDRIIRDAEELANVCRYIRMNPWRLVVEGTHEGRAHRGIGNPRLLDLEKIGVLCSRDCPGDVLRAAQQRAEAARETHCLIGGFHSTPEKMILDALLRSKAKLICCPAWGIDAMKIPEEWIPALEQNRMLILEMRNREADLAASRERNLFVVQSAEQLWVPHASRHGMVTQLVKEKNTQRKIIRN